MRSNTTWLMRAALIGLFSISTAYPVSAQTPGGVERLLENVLTPGMDVWITYSTGREERTRIVDVSGGIVTTAAGEEMRRLETADVVRIRARKSDSLLNGALIGAGIAVASELFLCRAMEPWDVCWDNTGPMFQIGAVGAGIGIGIDALIRGRKTIYQAGQPAARLRAAPIIGRDAAGLQFSLTF